MGLPPAHTPQSLPMPWRWPSPPPSSDLWTNDIPARKAEFVESPLRPSGRPPFPPTVGGSLPEFSTIRLRPDLISRSWLRRSEARIRAAPRSILTAAVASPQLASGVSEGRGPPWVRRVCRGYSMVIYYDDYKFIPITEVYSIVSSTPSLLAGK